MRMKRVDGTSSAMPKTTFGVSGGDDNAPAAVIFLVAEVKMHDNGTRVLSVRTRVSIENACGVPVRCDFVLCCAVRVERMVFALIHVQLRTGRGRLMFHQWQSGFHRESMRIARRVRFCAVLCCAVVRGARHAFSLKPTYWLGYSIYPAEPLCIVLLLVSVCRSLLTLLCDTSDGSFYSSTSCFCTINWYDIKCLLGHRAL